MGEAGSAEDSACGEGTEGADSRGEETGASGDDCFGVSSQPDTYCARMLETSAGEGLGIVMSARTAGDTTCDGRNRDEVEGLVDHEKGRR